MANQNMPADTYAPMQRGSGKGILIVTANKTEDLEFFYPYYRFIEAGFKVDVATPDGGEFAAKHGLGLKQTRKLSEVKSADYQMLYIPGGKAPAELKENKAAIEITQQFMKEGKPIAAICHGPQLLAAAGVIKGRRIAAWPEVENELKEAGAQFANEETVADGPFITARWPADLPAHMKRTLQALNSGQQRAAA